ncbi:MAG: hypothetical protein KatS3mg077_0406 [Candidatus Binatia bacterium]|nr:MAG: hypothetical protein KatS3mg077_0406 [Candidatus Binatia bacterium]
MVVTGSTFSLNVAGINGLGGGIQIQSGELAMEKSTLSSNFAGFGGGISNAPDGSVNLSNSTLSGNNADRVGGGIRNEGTVNASFVTIARNQLLNNGNAIRGGGISISANSTFNVKNSIVGLNTVPAGATGANCSILSGGIVAATGKNLATDGSCGSGFTNTSALNLGVPLGNNGGPTQTHALLSGSAAIDAVTDCTDVDGNSVSEDQRGVARPQDGDGDGMALCDVGAFEAMGVVVRTLTITKAGTGSGTVTSTPEGINCGSDCTESYADSTMVTLTATPNSGSTFAGWSGNADCTDGSVTMNADKTCTATFAVLRTLTITGAGTGNGTVTASGISCTSTAGTTSGDCTEGVADGTMVTLMATANPGSVFAGWGGDCSGSNTTTNVTMNADKSCRATFNLVGTIVIQKVAVGGNGTFNFSGPNGGSFTITTQSGAGSRSFSLAPGSYTVTETSLPSGWNFSNVVCQVTGGTGSTTSVTLDQRKAAINLAAGETVTCTFSNTRLGVSLLTLQDNGSCLTLDLQTRQYVMRTPRGTFGGGITVRRSGSVIRIRSLPGASPMLGATIDLVQRRGSAALVVPLSQGGGRFLITDPNIDDNGPCP